MTDLLIIGDYLLIGYWLFLFRVESKGADMDIKGKKVLVLGGAGLVGRALCRQVIEAGATSLVICSRFEDEAREFADELKREYPDIKCFAEWGDIFVRHQMKDLSREEIIGDHERRHMFLSDLINPLNREILTESTVFKLLTKHIPEIVLDSVNTASMIAYQNIFGVTKDALSSIAPDGKAAGEALERIAATQYVPQLIRHVQIMLQSMVEAKTRFYLKIGTCGTGGMGLNIPYTHSEDRPSQMLLAKSAIAGAHSLLLFLMARTPGGPIIKELKPAAAIAWKRVGFGPIKKRGEPIYLEDVSLEEAIPLKGMLSKSNPRGMKYIIKDGKPAVLEAPYIDTGENGFFSLGEFEALTDEGQMEFITPEEIAQCAVWEIKGLNTGRDIVAALDNSVLGPTYRAGYMRYGALSEMRRLVDETGVESVAFEILGPPRLSKLLYEGFLLRECFRTFEGVIKSSPDEMSKKLEERIIRDSNLRSRIVSIGIPILMADGNRLLRGSRMAIPPDISGRPDDKLEVDEEKINKWAHDGWVDLRRKNMAKWQTRFKTIMSIVEDVPASDTSSAFTKGRRYWQDADGSYPISFAKLTSWIFINEDRGERMKW